MQDLLDFLVRHGHLVVFLWVLLGQAGLPVPTGPLLIAAGALAGAGSLDLLAVVALSVVATLISDGLWYEIGRRRGAGVLNLLCRISLEPESCVRRTENAFVRRGALTLVVAKFVPGLSTAAPPLAGVFHMGLRRFLLLDGLGAVVWTLAYVVPGWVFSDQLERIVDRMALTGAWLLGGLTAGVGLYVLVKFVQRRIFLRALRIARITPEDLRTLIETGQPPPFVVDLRHPLDFDAEPLTIPGALHLSPEEIDARHVEIPRDRDIVLCCTVPNEVTSARVALLLVRRGITRVRPLAGGLEAWRSRGFPLADHHVPPRPRPRPEPPP